jgi:tetratricopeptide (TPR) repeat protein
MRAAVLLTVLSWGALYPARTIHPPAGNLPALPEVETAHFLPAIRNQVREAELAARAHPLQAGPVGKFGMVLDAYEQFEAAEACYRRAAVLDPLSFAWTYNLASVELQQGEYDIAARDFGRARQLDPRSLVAEIHQGESLLGAGDWNESAKIFGDVLKDDPRSATALYGLGRALGAQGKHAEAIPALLQACDLYPNYGAAHFALASIYRKLGDRERAEKQIALYGANQLSVPPLDDSTRSAVASLDLSANSRLRRSAEMERAGDLQGAVVETKKALEVDPSDVQAHINLIILYGKLGEAQESEAQFKQAVALNPNRADAYYNYGVLLFGSNRIPEAEQAFRRAIEINPHYAESHHNLGLLLEREGRTPESAKEYRLALEDRPDYRLAHYHLARLLVSQGHYAEAVTHLLETLAPEDDSTPGFLLALGTTYADAGDREHALVYLHKARDLATKRSQRQLLPAIEKALTALEH